MPKIVLVSLISIVILKLGYVDGLSCYQCTSLNNTKCGDPFKAKDTLKECPENEEHLVHLNVTAALSCRKLKQTIDGKVRVTRSCGFIPETEEKSCYKNAFTAFTSSLYCSCQDDHCNGGSGAKLDLILLCATLVTITQNFVKQYLH